MRLYNTNLETAWFCNPVESARERQKFLDFQLLEGCVSMRNVFFFLLFCFFKGSHTYPKAPQNR